VSVVETWNCSRCDEPTSRLHQTERDCWNALKGSMIEPAELQAVTMERDMLRAALAELLEDARDMRSYVPDYFAEKWRHDEALERAARALVQDARS
jgi:hypothetical protein